MEKFVVDYSFHCAISYWDDYLIPLGMKQLVDEIGINSFKVFLAYKDTLQLYDDECIKVLKVAKNLGAFVMAHCENGEIVSFGQQVLEAGVVGPEGHYHSRVDEGEAEATHRIMITLAAEQL